MEAKTAFEVATLSKNLSPRICRSARRFAPFAAPCVVEAPKTAGDVRLQFLFRNTFLREKVLVEEASLARIRINDFSKRALWDSGERFG
jgi:hypothetical protein